MRRLLYKRLSALIMAVAAAFPAQLSAQPPASEAERRPWWRRPSHEAVLVVLNMSSMAQEARLDLASHGLTAARRVTLLTDGSKTTRSGGEYIQIEPFAAYIEKLTY